MIAVPEVTVESVTAVRGTGEDLLTLALRAVEGVGDDIGGVIAATFSHAERFPALSVRVASALGLSVGTPAFDVQMACSAYPYALYLAGRLSADTGRRVLVVDGDVQLPLVDGADAATGAIFSDAVTASVVRSAADASARSSFDFLSRADSALTCASAGPIKMDGFAVFTFVATEVSRFLKGFPREADVFVPHQANPYMVRQLARAVGYEDRLLTIPDAWKNPGSCSVALTLACHPEVAGRRALVAGFGAGYSAAAGIVRLAGTFVGKVV